MTASADRASLHRDGYAVVADAVSPERCPALAEHLERHARRGAGSRRLLDVVEFAAIAGAICARADVREAVGGDASPWLATGFTKSPDAPWGVALHRDLTAPAGVQADTSSWTAWTEKEGEAHARPPTELLARLVAVRVQLDAPDERAGPLEVVPGSHLDADPSECDQGDRPRIAVLPARGGAILMRPLLLHASRRPLEGAPPRRILHVLCGPARAT